MLYVDIISELFYNCSILHKQGIINKICEFQHSPIGGVKGNI